MTEHMANSTYHLRANSVDLLGHLVPIGVLEPGVQHLLLRWKLEVARNQRRYVRRLEINRRTIKC